jgi:hypothetical protein
MTRFGAHKIWENPSERDKFLIQSLLGLLVAIFYFSTFLGCSTIEETSSKAEENKVYMDYAKKKENLPDEYLSEGTGETIQKEEAHSFEELVALGDDGRLKGNYSLSLTYFQKALVLEPESVGVHRKIGDLFFERGMPKDACS